MYQTYSIKFQIRRGYLLLGAMILGAGCVDVVPVEMEQRMEARQEKKAEYVRSVRELLVFETAKGNLVFRLFPDDAPKTVQQVRAWVQAGVYDQTWFHRVLNEPLPFIVQGGDINTKSLQPASNPVELELQSLQFGSGTTAPHLLPETTKRKHVEGALALAVAEDGSRAGPQFVISLARLPHLDGSEPVFGQLVGGWSVLQRLEVGDIVQRAHLQLPEAMDSAWMHDHPKAPQFVEAPN